MSWIQENKFAATLLGVTVVASGALTFLGMGANSDADAARQRELVAVKKIDALQSAKPYPSLENERLLADSLAIFAADTKKFQDAMLTFRPKEMRELSPDQFSDEVSKYTKKLTRYYKSKNITLPNKGESYFGMELYKGSMANKDATRYLHYDRQALEWLFTTLADSGIEKLNNCYRAPIAETLGKAPKQVTAPRGRRANNRNTQPAALTSVYEGLPMEITFTGTEASLQEFVTKVSAANEYFFAIKYLKVRNEEQDTVTISSATFKEPAATPKEGTEPAPVEGTGFDLGAGFDFGVDESLALQDKEIIKQVIGDEKITVFMQLELVLFKEAPKVIIPRLKIDKPVKKSSKKVSTK